MKHHEPEPPDIQSDNSGDRSPERAGPARHRPATSGLCRPPVHPLPRGRRPVATVGPTALLLALLFLLHAAPAVAAWTSADERFADYLIRRLQYFDTATRWLDEKTSERGIDERARAQIEAKRLDILRGRGDDEAFAKALEKFKRDYPWHPRSSVGSLEEIGEKLGRVLAQLEQAAVVTEAEAQPLRESAKTAFAQDVIASLDALIDEQNQKLAQLREQLKDLPDPLSNDEYRTQLVGRDRALLARIRFYLNYGRKWPEGTVERKEALEKALELGDAFIDRGSDFYVMEYDAQLNRGIIAYELGRYVLASDHLSVLYDIYPPTAPPYQPTVVTAIRDVRLQAILYGTRALSAAGNYREARRVIEENLLGGRKDDPFNLAGAEDEDVLRKFVILAKLEYAVALAGDGESQRAFKEIRSVIERYEGSEVEEDRAYVTDARKALGRLAQMEGVSLRGQDYYEAARGLKSEFKFEDALTTFRTALRELSPGEFMEYAPLCLNEIAENLVLLKRYPESAVAYAELFESFGQSLDSTGIASRASKNFLHATTKAIETTGGSTHSGWQALNELATEQYDRYGGSGLGPMQALMVQAGQLERESEFEAARETYLKVPAEIDRKGEKIRVPFYWRAQASAEAMVFELWRRAGPGDAQNPWNEAIGRSVERLGEILAQALGTEPDGAATAALTLGQIHLLKEEWKAAEDALRVFSGELKDSEDYRCAGAGYLALCLSRQGKCDEARDVLESIRKPCASSNVLGYAALNLSDCFYEAGDARFAARYVLIYALHDSSRSDLRNLDTLLMVTSRLAEGAGEVAGKTKTLYLKGTRKFLEMARKHPGAGDAEYQRQFALIDVKVYRAEGNERKAIEVLEKYKEDFDPQLGANPEDPYVYHELAEIYWSRTRGAKSGPTVKDAQLAEKNYEASCALLESRLRVQPALEPTFWRWALRLMEVRMYLGDSGSTASYGQIINFVRPRLGSDMGGLKAEFQRLLETAEEKKAKRS